MKLPEADNSTEYQLSLPFVIYTDFESAIHKQDSCEPLYSKSFTTQYQYHVPCGSCIYVKCSDGQYLEPPQVDIGDDTAEQILDQFLAAATICRQHLANKIPRTMEGMQQPHEPFDLQQTIQVSRLKSPQPDHLTGEYRGPAHNACNLN